MFKKSLDYITKNPKGQKQWGIGFAITGTIISITMAILFWKPENSLYQNIGPSISVPIGFLCVYLLGIRKNFGNILGITANINEIAVNTLFGNFGFVMSAIYFGFSHIVGYIDWNKNKEEDGSTSVRDLDMKQGMGTLIFFLVLGTLFIAANWYFKFFGDTSLTSPMFWANVAVMYLSIVAQGTMVLRYRYSWWIWFATNVISIPVQFASGNYVFGVMYIFYEINCILAIYAQYSSSVDTETEVLQTV